MADMISSLIPPLSVPSYNIGAKMLKALFTIFS